MYSGFSINPDLWGQDFDPNIKKMPSSSSNYPESPENKFLHDFVTPVLEEGGDSHMPTGRNQPYFESDNRMPYGYGKMTPNQPIFNGRADNGFPMNHQPNYNRVAGFPGPNMTLNQLNSLPMNMRPNIPNERNTPNANSKDLVRQPSLTNVSGSKNGSRVGSKTNLKGNKSYQVTLNEDINLIERIEVALNQITMNHNKICPFCSKMIDIKKCNFQNISAFLSNTSKRYYLTHFDCYLKSNSNPDSAKILTLANVAEARLNSQIKTLTNIETSNYLRTDRKAYFVSIEGYHPISSYLLFRIEKICNGLEHASHRNQLLYINMAAKTSALFEQSAYPLPYSEFRLVITIHMSHANEDSYTFEFLMDFSQVKLGLNEKSKFAEAFYLQGGNNIIIGSEIVFDPANELSGVLNQKAALDSSFQSTGSTTPGKPDFGKNLFVVMQHISISLPLKRIESRPVEVSSKTSLDESMTSSQKPTPQKKPINKLQLNPNAPLFSNGNERSAEPAPQQKIFFPTNGQSNTEAPSNFNQNPNHFQSGPRGPAVNGNLFNAPLFPQNFAFEQILGSSFNTSGEGSGFDPAQETSGVQDERSMPPGLNFTPFPQNNQMNGQLNYNPLFPNQPVLKSGRSLYVETKAQAQQDPQSFIKEEDETVDTPEKLPTKSAKDDSSLLRPDRSKSSKAQQNLYTAVLSGKFKENSILNSPALNKIHNHYFSEISNPASGINTPEANTPLYSSMKVDLESEESTNVQWTEDMVENFKLEDYEGELVEFAKTYNGSRVLQRFFPRANQQEVERVILELQDHIEELMLDPYANYMFQTLAQSCSSEQRYYLLKKISPSMIKIACDRKGTHSLQAIVSLMNRDIEDKLIRDTLNGHVVDLTFDAQGTHLIQKLIVAISINNLGFIYKPLIGRFLEIANNAFGLCVLKQLMVKVEKAPEMKKEIITLLHENFEDLVQNPYGNYAIQHAFDIYSKECDVLFEKVIDKIVQYSNQKFSSNVVEKCISLGTSEIRKKYVKEILKSDRMVELMKNKYGNYVILKILATAELEDKQAIVQSLIKNVNLVNVTKYKNRWLQFIEENPLKIPGVNNTKVHKPSLFKSSAQGGENPNRESFELNSPMTADDWTNLRQQAVRRGSKEIKDDKSQFFHENKGNQLNGHTNVDENNSFENRNHNNLSNQTANSGYERDNEDIRYNNGENGNNKKTHMTGNGQREQGDPSNKKNKNHNHKFYIEKSQHYKNKLGYNYFY
jgi:hypothetical protein